MSFLGVGVVVAVTAILYFRSVSVNDTESPARLTLRGKLLMPDGGPAAGALVKSVAYGDLIPEVVTTNALGEFTLEDLCGEGAQLQATASEGKLIATLWVSADSVRKMASIPITLALAPAAVRSVNVTAQGRPAAGAHVCAIGHTFQVDAITDSDGRALLYLPANGEMTQLVSWHPRLGVDGLFPPDEQVGVDFSRLSLRPPGTHEISVVDTEGNAVANLDLGILAGMSDFTWTAAEKIPATHVRTDARGNAVLTWAPNTGLENIDATALGGNWHVINVDDQQTVSGKTSMHVARIELVRGRVHLPAGAQAEGILVKGCGPVGHYRSHISYTRTSQDGFFTLPVVSGVVYAVSVIDFEWGSDLWAGTPSVGGHGSREPIAIDTHAAAPLTVHVTYGPDAEPVADAWLEVSRRSVTKVRNADEEARIAIVGCWLRTDHEGKATTGVGRGQINVRLSPDVWDEEKVVVAGTTPISVKFHHPSAEFQNNPHH